MKLNRSQYLLVLESWRERQGPRRVTKSVSCSLTDYDSDLELVIEDAERQGLLHPNTGSRIFEGTVGSTGISIATIAKARLVS